jgi:hypothetical protein
MEYNISQEKLTSHYLYNILVFQFYSIKFPLIQLYKHNGFLRNCQYFYTFPIISGWYFTYRSGRLRCFGGPNKQTRSVCRAGKMRRSFAAGIKRSGITWANHLLAVKRKQSCCYARYARTPLFSNPFFSPVF